MAQTKQRVTQLGIILVLLAIILTGGAATYAWFTSNNIVDTNGVSVDSGTDSLVVEVGNGSSWSQAENTSLLTDASYDGMTLYPVSTFDLESFVECTFVNDDGQATKFAKAEDGVDYYHGYLYIRARMEGSADTTGTVQLYLSQPLKTTNDDSDLLKAARIGIKFSKNGTTESAHYFELDSTPGSHQSEHPTTAPDLASYKQGMLLGWQDGKLAAGADKVESASDYLISGSTRPESSLVSLELDTVYRMDVYYYIEGCDADSSNSLSGAAGLLTLDFYAALDMGEGA